MAFQIKVPANQTGAPFVLVARQTQNSDPQITSDENLTDVQMSVKAISKPWSTVTGSAAVMTALAEQSRHKDHMLGSDDESKKEVSKWLKFRDSEDSGLSSSKLQKLNEHLKTRNYLVGNGLTLADLSMFTAVQPEMSNILKGQTAQLVNLVRWFDHIQHTADTTNVFDKVAIEKPPFQMPAQPAAQAKDKGGKDEKGGKAKDKTKDKAASAAQAPATATAAAAAPADNQPPQDATAAAPAEGKGGKKKEKKEKKEKAAQIMQLDIRIGKIVECSNHPDAEKLYVEKIDLGEGEPRTIVSGLRLFVPLEEMQGRHVVVLANLKPAKLVGIPSAGMVLCASNDDHTQVNPISPPEGVSVGERVTFEGQSGEPEAQLNPKKKIFEELSPHLNTDADGVCRFKDVAFSTSKGPVTATLPNAAIK